MVSKESKHSLAQCNIINQDKAMTVRSVLLNRDSPDIESRLKRRRNRTQQVRFKDQVDGTDEDPQKIHSDVPPPKSALKTPSASTSHVDAERTITPPIVYCSSAGRVPPQPSRRHWYQSRPCSLTLPNPKKVSMSTAIQTSPSLQKTFPAFRFRSKSVSDFGKEELVVALANHREKREVARTNDKHVSSYNGETSDSRTLNGGIPCFSEHIQQPSPHQALTETKKHARRRQHHQWQQAPLCSRIPEEAQCQRKAENGTHPKEHYPSELLPNSPEFHPFYPTNVPSEDCVQMDLVDSNDDGNVSPQWIPHERRVEAESRVKPSSEAKDCDAMSPCSRDSKRMDTRASETPSTLTKDSPSSRPCNSQQSSLPLVLGTLQNCTERLPTTQTSKDAIPRDTALTHEPPHNSARTLGKPKPQDHSSVSDRPAVPCTSPVDESPSTPHTRQAITTPHNNSPDPAKSAATCQQEFTQIPENISATSQQPHIFNVKKDLGPVGQREEGALSTDSSNKPLSSTSEPGQQQELSARSSPSLHTDAGAPSFSSSSRSHIEDPLEEYYTVRTRDPPPAHTEAASESADPAISLANPAGEAGVTVDPSQTLRQVQDLLELVAAAKGRVDLAKEDRDLLSQGRRERAGCLSVNKDAGPNQGRQYYKGDVSARLQALEGVLETSQQTIKVLLDVIQDLEKKEAQRDGRHSYRTGQDIENCGTCRDCACIIYSVEHDFRQQEGRFLRVLSSLDDDSPQIVPPPPAPSQQEPSPAPKQPPKMESKRSKRKCFWFL
ncbi:uncharacterized protein LOC144821565 [Lissotriton helveticus]